jgi:hypothetical protein
MEASMKTLRFLASVITAAIMAGSLGACAAQTKDPYSRTVKVTTPLSEPIYGGASIEPFSEAKPFKKMNDFIFKGKIEKIQEVDINYNVGTTEDIYMVDQWFSVCNVK